jgi:c-di-GMP-related signal transduction protein
VLKLRKDEPITGVLGPSGGTLQIHTSSPMSTPASSVSRVFIARQPILDRAGRVFGYELLHRAPSAGAEAPARAGADDRATAHLLTDSLLTVGFEALTGGKHALISVSRHFLLHGIPDGLPPSSVTLVLGGDVEADSDIVAACRDLRRAGYGLALDSVALTTGHRDLLALATYVRINFREATTPVERRRLLTGLPAGVQQMATHLDTAERFHEATTEGYAFFQGGFFGKVVVKEGRSVPTHQVAQLRLMRSLSNPNLSVHQLAELIKPDPAMCYRVLRAVNSARFARQTTVTSIPDALVQLGRDTVKRWVSLWAMASLGSGNQALMAAATVRGRFCELLTQQADDDDTEGFLLGLCSMLDAILERPLDVIITDLPLTSSTKSALLGEDTRHGRILKCAIAYEQGDWDQAIELAEAAGLNPDGLTGTYSSALQWVRDLEQLTAEAGSAA